MPDDGTQQSLFPDLDDTIDVDMVTVMRRIAAQAVRKQEAGGSLTREEFKAIRELAILEVQDTHWPNRLACADELGYTPKQLEHLAAEARAEGFDIFPAHAPLQKVPILTYLVQRYRAEKDLSTKDEAGLKHQRELEELRKIKIANDQREGRYVHEANTLAADGLATVVRTLKPELIWALPDRCYDVCRKEDGLASRRTAVPAMRTLITQTLTDLARRAGALDDLLDTTDAPTPTRKRKKPARKQTTRTRAPKTTTKPPSQKKGTPS